LWSAAQGGLVLEAAPCALGLHRVNMGALAKQNEVTALARGSAVGGDFHAGRFLACAYFPNYQNGGGLQGGGKIGGGHCEVFSRFDWGGLGGDTLKPPFCCLC
jgi:hypothetical protein